MAVLRAVWKWLKENPWAIIVALLSVGSAYLLLKRKDNKIADLKDAVAVENTRKVIAANEAKAEVIKANADAKDEDIKKLDREIAASKRRVMEIHEGESLEVLNDAQVAALFSSAGL